MTEFTIVSCANCGATFVVERIIDVCEEWGVRAGSLVGCCKNPASVVMCEGGKDLKVDLQDDDKDSYCWSPPKGRFDIIMEDW